MSGPGRPAASPLFDSFFLGGFECSSHHRRDGSRLDLLALTQHDRLAEADYRALSRLGIRSVRDGLRWHLIETAPGRYDWSSFLPMLRAAKTTRTQVIWDLLHYGWPDGLDIYSAAFVERFAGFAGAAMRLIREETDQPILICPINEISFWCWAAAEIGIFPPFHTYRGAELKRQLVRAAIAAIEAARAVDPDVRIVHAEPLIHVTPEVEAESEHAECLRLAQFEAWDLLSGRQEPGLGGRADYLDVLGLNYYYNNQWAIGGRILGRFDPDYRPVSEMLVEVQARYDRPLFIAETGIEGRLRPEWLRYIGDELRQAIAAGVPIEGLCLYPVTDYLGWEDHRHCHTGLLGLPGETGRSVHQPLALELARQRQLFTGEGEDEARIRA